MSTAFRVFEMPHFIDLFKPLTNSHLGNPTHTRSFYKRYGISFSFGRAVGITASTYTSVAYLLIGVSPQSGSGTNAQEKVGRKG